jgi:hypothetical protein
MAADLIDAERSLLRFVPLFGHDRSNGNKPHLNDGEVARLVGTCDRAAFATQPQAEIEERLGMRSPARTSRGPIGSRTRTFTAACSRAPLSLVP